MKKKKLLLKSIIVERLFINETILAMQKISVYLSRIMSKINKNEFKILHKYTFKKNCTFMLYNYRPKERWNKKKTA